MAIRRAAVFHNGAQVGSAWCCAEGLATTLAALGVEVLNCGHPLGNVPPLQALLRTDLIILGAPEWYADALLARYGAAWDGMDVPKVAWYAESAHRDDRSFDFAGCRSLADLHYFPAAQDAAEFRGEWLPFGVDTELFFPRPVKKRPGAWFLGTLYPKRMEYLRATGCQIGLLAQVHDHDPVHSFDSLCAAYSSAEIFVNLPAYSRLLVTKVTEVMACRTMLVTPKIDHPSGFANMKPFENGKHLVYYDQNRPSELHDIPAYYGEHADEREAIAHAGWEEVQRRHALRGRMERILSDAVHFQASRRGVIATT